MYPVFARSRVIYSGCGGLNRDRKSNRDYREKKEFTSCVWGWPLFPNIYIMDRGQVNQRRSGRYMRKTSKNR